MGEIFNTFKDYKAAADAEAEVIADEMAEEMVVVLQNLLTAMILGDIQKDVNEQGKVSDNTAVIHDWLEEKGLLVAGVRRKDA